MHKSIGLIALVLLASCARYDADIEPQWTSYPKDRVVETPVNMWIAPGFTRQSHLDLKLGSTEHQEKSKSSSQMTYDYIKTEHGDKAEEEVYLFSDGGYSGNEKQLWKRVPERGRKICSDEYIISKSAYLQGHEATLRMMGVSTPTLRVNVRCPVYSGKSSNVFEENVRSLARRIPEYRYFDVLVIDFAIDRDRLFELVKAVAIEEGMPVVSEGATSSKGKYVLAGHPPITSRWGIQQNKQLVAVVETADGGSRLSFELLLFQAVEHQRKVGENFPLVTGYSPMRRDVAYARARYFVSLIMKKLG